MTCSHSSCRLYCARPGNPIQSGSQRYNVSAALPEAAAKVLDISWIRDMDRFTFNPEDTYNVLTSSTLTRRQYTSHSSKIFHQLGLLSRTILLVKLQFYGLWKTKLGWDDPLPKQERSRWEDFITTLPFLNEKTET